MEQRTVLDEFEKHSDKRDSLKGRNAKVEASGESTIQGLEQHSSSRAVQVRAQLGTTFIVERNAHSSKPRSGENP